MRIALTLVVSVVAAPAFADEPAPLPSQPTPAAPGQVEPVTPEPEPAPAPPAEPPTNEMYVPSKRTRVDDIVVKSRPDRPTKSVIVLAAAAGVSVIVGGVGVYYHLDSRDASNEINAHKHTGVAWTAEKQDTYDRAHSSAVAAGVFYGIGGALLIGTAIAYMITEPAEETTILHPHTSTPVVAPTQGGAIVGGMWSF